MKNEADVDFLSRRRLCCIFTLSTAVAGIGTDFIKAEQYISIGKDMEFGRYRAAEIKRMPYDPADFVSQFDTAIPRQYLSMRAMNGLRKNNFHCSIPAAHT